MKTWEALVWLVLGIWLITDILSNIKLTIAAGAVLIAIAIWKKK